ncbi:MAG: transcriptional repressor [Clostridia bacterium]|nr:transcriptional repressor [Clostridia bacterium]
MTIYELIEILKTNHYKITAQRKALLQVMAEHADTLLLVDTIYEATKKRYPKTNMSTVYRNLEILESLDLLHKVANENGAMQYKLICCHHHHHHLICSQCGKIEAIDYCPLETLKEIAADKDFQLTAHKLELIGLCKHCAKKK